MAVKAKKTVGVRVVTLKRHPFYGKVIKHRKKYLADTGEFDDLAQGDEVEIRETRPISKKKRWQVVRKR